MLLAGAGCLAYAASIGQASVVVVLILPVLVGTGPWAFLGTLLLMAGFALGFFAWTGHSRMARIPGAPAGAPPGAAEGRTSTGGFLLLGPIPIAFGSTKRLAVGMLAVAIAVLLLMLLWRVAP